MINISNISPPLLVAAVGCFFLIISIIIYPFVIFKVHRDIEKKYRVIIVYPDYAYIGFLGEYAHLAFHVLIFYLYSILNSNSKFLRFILKSNVNNSFLTEFNYNVKEEKKSNLIICAILWSSLFLFGAFSICAGFMISPTWMFD